MSDSQVVTFLDLVWYAWPRSSYPQLNRSMRRALEVAVMIGMKFEKGDVSEIASRYRWQYWATNVEAIYSMAALGLKSHTGRLPRNTSAAKSFEHHWGRPAYFLNGARLVLGSRFAWKEDAVTVTSIYVDRLTACSYRDEAESKVKRRFSITAAELREAQRREREADRPPIWRQDSR